MLPHLFPLKTHKPKFTCDTTRCNNRSNFFQAVEYFLVHEVTHVISDRENISNSVELSPRTPSGSVEINYESPKPSTSTPKTGQSRLKTRAEAMLEKVRTQTQTTVTDPLKNAKLWGIPIWTVNKVNI